MGLYEVIKNRLGADIPTREKELNEIRDLYFREAITDDALRPSHVAIKKLLENTEIAEYKQISSIIEILAREALEYRENLDGKEYLRLAETFALSSALGVSGEHGRKNIATNRLAEEIGLDLSDFTLKGNFSGCAEKYHVQRALAIYNYANAIYAWDSGDREGYEKDLAKAKEAADKAYEAKKDDLQIVTYKILASKEGTPVVAMPFPIEHKREEQKWIDQELLKVLKDSYTLYATVMNVDEPLAYEVLMKLAEFSPESLDFSLGTFSGKQGGLIPQNPNCAYRARQAMDTYLEEIIEELNHLNLPPDERGPYPVFPRDETKEQRERFYQFVKDLKSKDPSEKSIRKILANMHRLYHALVTSEDPLIEKEEISEVVGIMRDAAKDSEYILHRDLFLDVLLNEGEYTELVEEHKDALDKAFVKRMHQAAVEDLKRIDIVCRILGTYFPYYCIAKEEQRSLYSRLCSLSSLQKQEIRATRKSLLKYNSAIIAYLKQMDAGIGFLERRTKQAKLPGRRAGHRRDLQDLAGFIEHIIRPIKQETVHFNKRIEGRECRSPIGIYLPALEEESRQLMHELNHMPKALLEEYADRMPPTVFKVIFERLHRELEKTDRLIKLPRKSPFSMSQEKVISMERQIGISEQMFRMFIISERFKANISKYSGDSQLFWRDFVKLFLARSNESEKEGKDKEAEPAAPEPEERQKKEGVLGRLAGAAAYMPRAVLGAMFRGAHKAVSEPAPDPESTAVHEVRESPDSPLPKVDHNDLKQAAEEYKAKKKPKQAVPGTQESPMAKENARDRAAKEALKRYDAKKRAENPQTPKVFTLESVQGKDKQQPTDTERSDSGKISPKTASNPDDEPSKKEDKSSPFKFTEEESSEFERLKKGFKKRVRDNLKDL